MSLLAGAAIGGGLLSGLGGYLGSKKAAEAQEAASIRAAELRRQAMQKLEGLPTYALSDLQYNPELLNYIEAPNPIFYEPYNEVEATLPDYAPEGRDAQLQAIQSLLDKSDEGLTAQEKYNFMRNRRDVESAARGRDLALQENLRARGMGGTGIEAALRMMSNQGAMDRLSEAIASQNALEADQRLTALSQLGQLGGQVRGQDMGAAQKSADILNSFALENSQRAREISNMNIDKRNRAAQQNVDEQRRIQGANIATSNAAELMREQQRLSNEKTQQQGERDKLMAQAGALTGQIPSVYAQGAAQAGQQAQMWQGIGQAAAAIPQTYAAYSMNQDYMDRRWPKQQPNAVTKNQALATYDTYPNSMYT